MDRDKLEGQAKEWEGKLTGDELRERQGQGEEGLAEGKEKAEDLWEGAKDRMGEGGE